MRSSFMKQNAKLLEMSKLKQNKHGEIGIIKSHGDKII